MATRARALLLPRAEGSGLTTSGPEEDATPEPPQARAGRPAVARRESKEAFPTVPCAAGARPEARDRKCREGCRELWTAESAELLRGSPGLTAVRELPLAPGIITEGIIKVV